MKKYVTLEECVDYYLQNKTQSKNVFYVSHIIDKKVWRKLFKDFTKK